MDLVQALTELRTIDDGLDDAACIDLIRGLEDLKSAAAAAQARASVSVEKMRRAERATRGLPQKSWSRGVAQEIALARRESHHRGGRHLGFARTVTEDMPNALALMETGQLSEWRATLIVRETICLSAESRARIDTELCSDAATLDGVGDRAVAAKAKKLAEKYDPAAIVARNAKAETERRVSVRPAPDAMAYLGALLPLKDAVACYARLREDAVTIVGLGDPLGRTHGQIMADLMVERITGRSKAEGHPIQINLVISDQGLFGGGTEPGWVPGFGDVPADLARDWVKDVVALRRIYACPESGTLTAMDSKSRVFPAGLARFIDIRDKTCRTPWCEAPIRHHDHIQSYANGGDTTAANGAGLCEACNYAKEGDGFTAIPDTESTTHAFTITTPTGHQYYSVAPELPKPAARVPAVAERATG